MKKIDKFILRQYLATFFFCILLFLTIIVVVDISEHTDDFVQSKLSSYQIFTDYYVGFIPRIMAMLFPLFNFIAVIFFTSKMAGRSEVIAILSSGVSFKRFTLPYIFGGTILAALLAVGFLYAVPKANKKWADFDKNYIKVNTAAGRMSNAYKQNIYFKLTADSYIGIKGYDTLSKSGVGFFEQRFKEGQMTYNLRASNFNWDTASRKWQLTKVMERDLFSITEKVKIKDQVIKSYNFGPTELSKDDYLKDQMTTPQLNQFIKMERMRGSDLLAALLVEKYNRLAIPASVLILTIIGVAMSSRKVRGGSGAHLALGVLISVSYILFSRFSVVFATQGNFSPFLAAWLPNFIFGFLAIYLFIRASR